MQSVHIRHSIRTPICCHRGSRSVLRTDEHQRGGAIALGHPPGVSGARGEDKTALAAMCIGVGQGFAIALEAA